MAKKKTKKPNRWASQAAVQALLRYGPQESALSELQRQAEGTYRTSLAQARGSGDMSVEQIKAAVPQTQQIFDRASRQDQLANLFRSQITGGAAGTPADVLAQGSKIEQAQNLTNLGMARGQALNALTERKVAARSGVQYATENARQQFVSDLGKVLQQKADIAGQKGAYTSLTAQQLQDAADERAQALAIAEGQMSQSERNSLRSSGTDPDTGLPTTDAQISADKASRAEEIRREKERNRNRGKVSGTGAPLLSVDKHLSDRSEIERAMSIARRGKAAGRDRRKVGRGLLAGAPGGDVYDEPGEDGKRKPQFNQDGTKKQRPEIKPVESQLLATAALDMEYDGHISRKTQRMLADAGYSIKRLGLTTYAQWKKTREPTRRGPKGSRTGVAIKQGAGR